jgi:transcriptional regulator with PAS, ATPase and Fis domain
MPIGTQAKLLRVLEERKLRRLGARTEQDVDVRVLAATNRNPEEAVAPNGQLRSDLLLSPECLSHSHAAAARASGGYSGYGRGHAGGDEPEAWPRVAGVSPAVLERLKQHEWPGNARELRNLMERAVILARMAG